MSPTFGSLANVVVTFRKRSYVFIFWNSKKVDLEKMYMHERKYSNNGVLEKGPIVSKDIGDPTSAIHRFFTRTVQGFPKKFRNDVISESKGKYPAICPMMVYEIAYLGLQSNSIQQNGPLCCINEYGLFQ